LQADIAIPEYVIDELVHGWFLKLAACAGFTGE
jgi:hypothetical protein